MNILILRNYKIVLRNLFRKRVKFKIIKIAIKTIKFLEKEVIVMNLCFLIGKIISEINFKFVLNSKNISVAYFKVELNNKSIVEVKAYNELADYCYSKLEKGNKVEIQGCLNNEMEIIIEEFNVLNKINII